MADVVEKVKALIALAVDERGVDGERANAAMNACKLISQHKLLDHVAAAPVVTLADILQSFASRTTTVRGTSRPYYSSPEVKAEPTASTERIFVPVLTVWRGVAASGRACAPREAPHNYLIRFYSSEENESVEEFIPANQAVVLCSDDTRGGLGIKYRYALQISLPSRVRGVVRRVV